MIWFNERHIQNNFFLNKCIMIFDNVIDTYTHLIVRVQTKTVRIVYRVNSNFLLKAHSVLTCMHKIHCA
jgi:hypothetical protein